MHALVQLLVIVSAIILEHTVGELVSTFAGSLSTTSVRQSIQNGRGVDVNTAGNFYVADMNYNTIVLISAADRSVAIYAGGGSSSEENAVGTSIYINGVWGISSDTMGKLYYSEMYGCRVRMLSAAKVATTIMGSYGTCTYNSNGVSGPSTYLNNPRGVHFDPIGNKLYVADQGNHVVRAADMSSSSYTTTVVAGMMGSYGLADNVVSVNSMLYNPFDVWVNTVQDVFIADYTNCRIRKITKSTGIISTIAGTGTCSYSTGTVATSEYLSYPYSICGDTAGTVYFTQTSYVRKVTSAGAMTTVAGSSSSTLPPVSGVAGTSISVGESYGSAVNASGSLFFFDYTAKVLWSMSAPVTGSSIITARSGFTNGLSVPATSMSFTEIHGLWGNTIGNLYISEYSTYRVYEVAGGMVTGYAGTGVAGVGSDGIAATQSKLYYPRGVGGDAAGNVYIADYQSCRIRKVTASTKIITTIAGYPSGGSDCSSYSISAQATSVYLCYPLGVALDTNGNLYFSDETYTIRKIVLSSGIMSLLAGNGAQGHADSTSATTGSIGYTRNLWVNTAGMLFAADSNYWYVRAVNLAINALTSYAGNGNSFTTNGLVASSTGVGSAYGVCGDVDGSLYIASYSNYRILSVKATTGILTAAIGQGSSGVGSEGVAASSTAMGYPYACFVDSVGKIYYAETWNSDARVRTTVSRNPTSQPTNQPSRQPSTQPSKQPISVPTGQPSKQPAARPSSQPSLQPRARPSSQPSTQPSLQPASSPTSQPSIQPSLQPQARPSSQPSAQPSLQPAAKPSSQPSSQPSKQPQARPSSQPSAQPSLQPAARPSTQPSSQPSLQPQARPSSQPSAQPSLQPAAKPSSQPSSQPSKQPQARPSSQPSAQPSLQPVARPSTQPSSQPSLQPQARPTSQPSVQPSLQPTARPSTQPSNQPSLQPQARPSCQPSAQPSLQPVSRPTAQPSRQPSLQPQARPSSQPSAQPSLQPAGRPSTQPSSQPSLQPQARPSSQPSLQPSLQPVARPSTQPSSQPSLQPQGRPSSQPSAQPSVQPASRPSAQPSRQPSLQPQARPTAQPSVQPSHQPSLQPQARPSSQPSAQPSVQPMGRPSTHPSSQPSLQPQARPSTQPSAQPSLQPVSRPTAQPSRQPSLQPQARPTSQPSVQPSNQPSLQPQARPTSQPSAQPSLQPASRPTAQPSCQPSLQPQARPSAQPTLQPSRQPTSRPSAQPSGQPSVQPHGSPTSQPSAQPSRQPSAQPSLQPAARPSTQPSNQPSLQPQARPTSQPSTQPSQQPASRPSAQPSSQPSLQPQARPSSQPSAQPSAQPSSQPSRKPSVQPSRQPSSRPSTHPTGTPTSQPSEQPSSRPSLQPVMQPTAQPSTRPTSHPSAQPSVLPSTQPSSQPSVRPSVQPSARPTAQPSALPSQQPFGQPSSRPSVQPTSQPSNKPSHQPSAQPTVQPSEQPSSQPTTQPTSRPSVRPTGQPSTQPTVLPSAKPSTQPSSLPTSIPSVQPTCHPSVQPTATPSRQPTTYPSGQPSGRPTSTPSAQPSAIPTGQPSACPTRQPTSLPSAQPSCRPSSQPTSLPTSQPSGKPSSQPTGKPSAQPSGRPTSQPTVEPSSRPTSHPTSQPSVQPTSYPSAQPSGRPTGKPSTQPSGFPSSQPTVRPTSQPTVQPTRQPSQKPSAQPSLRPTGQPSVQPSSQPTKMPSTVPTVQPSTHPTGQPSSTPTAQPSAVPTVQPSVVPTCQPSRHPSSVPSSHPSSQPSARPTVQPSGVPSACPTAVPSGKPSSLPSAQPSAQPSSSPSTQPSGRPSLQPTSIPSVSPSSRPSSQPSSSPTTRPSIVPTSQPTSVPSSMPSRVPTTQPSGEPSAQPSTKPSVLPSSQPTTHPSSIPSSKPTLQPSASPTDQPTSIPSGQPSCRPSTKPTGRPSVYPTGQPSARPTSQPSRLPSSRPSAKPTGSPSSLPSLMPAAHPSSRPSSQPSSQPSSEPTRDPTASPTSQPSTHPTSLPSAQPWGMPSFQPAADPTSKPSVSPTRQPASHPTVLPSTQPSSHPSFNPVSAPTGQPSWQPSSQPSKQPFAHPSQAPTKVTEHMLKSASPSPAPSTMPTFSLTDQWKQLLQADLVAVPKNDSAAVVTRRTYYGLRVGSKDVYGGCGTWNTWLAGDLSPAAFSFIPTSIQYITQTSLFDRSTDVVRKCSTKSVVRQIVSALTATASSSTNVSCQGNQWIVASCGSVASGGKASLCVNCADPCSSSLVGSTIAPCSATSDPSLSMLSIGMEALDLPPSMITISFSAKADAVDVSVHLAGKGSSYCGLFASTASAPASTDEILLQNRGNVSSPATNVSFVSFSGLSPVSSYRIYCFAMSSSGSRTSLSTVLEKSVGFTTACCRRINAQLASSSIVEGLDKTGFLTISVEGGAPRQNLRLSMIASKVVSALNLSVVEQFTTAFMPTSFDVSSSTPAVLSTSLSRLVAGVYRIELDRSGGAAADYSVQFGGSNRSFAVINVVASSTPLEAPVLLSATFSGDGSTLKISFDRETNRAGKPSSFACSALFSFNCANVSTCSWIDDTSVNAFVRSSGQVQCVSPLDPLMLIPSAAVKAKCRTGCSSQSTWPNAIVSAIVTVAAPPSAVSPSVVISVPDTVGSCASLALDLSSSSGDGGRAWARKIVQISSMDSSGASRDASTVQSYVSGSKLQSLIPASSLVEGYTYFFQATLCNFLGSCTTGSKKTVVLPNILPTVSIVGPVLVSMKRMAMLSLKAQGFIPSCTNTTAVDALAFSWTVSKNNIPELSLVSTSKDPMRLMLPSYALQTNTLYTVISTATALSTSKSASATMQVFVTAGDIVVVIRDGWTKTVRVGEELRIDASGSYDEDVAIVVNGVRPSGGLIFAWACSQTAPVLNASCGSIFHSNNIASSKSSSVFILSALSSAADAKAQAVLTLSDESGGRTVSTVVDVTVLPSLAPQVQISSSSLGNSIKFNAAQALQLVAKVGVPADLAGSVQWNIDSSSGVSLRDVALSPALNASFAASPIAFFYTFYLPINARVLPAGVSLSFSLSCILDSPGKSATSSLDIVINSPPRPGTFIVFADGDVELTTPFSFSCSQWVDEDLPLTYQFGYTSSLGVDIILRSKALSAIADLKLPAGLESNDFHVSAVAEVFDSLAGNSTARFAVRVTAAPVMSSTQLEDFVQSSFAASNDTDSIRQASALSSYLLNKVDCSLAPNCSALHRQACSRTAQTCGPCLSDDFLGDDGDSNAACISSADVEQGTSSSFELKPCPSNCSDHGTCFYTVIVTGEPLDKCFADDLTCNANCLCEADYASSTTCSLSTSAMDSRRALRENLLDGLLHLTVLEDADTAGLQVLINHLQGASQAADELSTASSDSVLQLASYVLSNARTAGLNNDAAADLLGPIQASLTSTTTPAGRRRLQAGNYSSDAALLLERSQIVLAQLAEVLANNMIPGQAAFTNVQPSFRMHVSKMALDSGSSGCNSASAGISLPTKLLERRIGVQAGGLSLPSCGHGNSTEMTVSMISTSGALYGNEVNGSALLSDPLSLSLSAFPCTTLACKVEFVLSMQKYRNNTASNGVEEAFNISCAQGDVNTYQHQCSTDGKTYSLSCQGRKEIIHAVCPSTRHEQACSITMGGGGCEVVMATPDNITCSCSLINGLRAQSSTTNITAIPSGSVSVNYVSILKAVTSSFLTTVLTADNLNGASLAHGYRALVTIGSFVICVLSAVYYSYQADQKAKKVDPGADDKKEARKRIMQSFKSASGLMVKPKKVEKKKKDKKGVLAMAEDALPKVLCARTFNSMVKEEMKRHHRWFGIVYHFSDKLPRVLRVVSLSTNIIAMLFIQSVTYNLTNGDDGSCERFDDSVTCLAEPSAFSTGGSKCYWTPSTAADGTESGTCAYLQPGDSMTVVLFVAIFSAILATPIAIMSDYIITKFLSPPTKTDMVRSGSDKSMQLASIAPAPARGSILSVVDPAKDAKMLETVQVQFAVLVDSLKRYLSQLQDEKDKTEFKSLWGLDDDGNFIQTVKESWTDELKQSWCGFLQSKSKAKETEEKKGVAAMVFSDLLRVQRSLVQETSNFKDPLARMSEQAKNKRLLFLFQRDLLPGISGQILESKDARDHVEQKSVSAPVKWFAWSFLTIFNAGLLFYIFLFAISQDSYRQTAWAKSFALWLVSEIFVISSCMVLLTHIAIPSLIMKDVKQIKQKLVDSVIKYHQLLSDQNGAELALPPSGSFNAAEYLFVSYRMARTFARLKTAQIIGQYQTVWPRQSYQRATDMSKTYDRKFTALTRSVSVVIFFLVTNLLSVPVTLQDMVIQMASTAVTGYTFLIHVQLFSIFPVLVIIPTIFLGVLIHFMIQASKRKHEEDLQGLLQSASKEKKSKQAEHKTNGKNAPLGGAGRMAKYASESDMNSIISGLSADEKSIRSLFSEENNSEDGPLHMPVDAAMFGEYLLSSDSSASSQHPEIFSDDEEEDDEYALPLPFSTPHGSPSKHIGRRSAVQQGVDLLQFAQQQYFANMDRARSISDHSGQQPWYCSSLDTEHMDDCQVGPEPAAAELSSEEDFLHLPPTQEMHDQGGLAEDQVGVGLVTRSNSSGSFDTHGGAVSSASDDEDDDLDSESSDDSLELAYHPEY